MEKSFVRTRILVVLIVVVLIAGGLAYRLSAERALNAKAKGYNAVLLDNNAIYFGKLTDLGSDYPVLTDVFYIQTSVNQETKQQSNMLVKRGKEWHAPDKMVLNARHIVMIEPVTAGSTVAKLIAQAGGK
jgi:hypothetical protein